MKILIILVAAALLLAAGALLYKHFITDCIMDKGGMENPDYTGSPDDLHLLDGNYTYVDNGVLLDVIAGSWSSADGRYVLTLDGDCRAVLALEGETVLEGSIAFTYLQPGDVQSTEFDLDSTALRHSGGAVFAEVSRFYHEAGDDGGRLIMELSAGDGGGTVEFTKTGNK